MEDKEEKISLRDQMALRIVPALIGKDSGAKYYSFPDETRTNYLKRIKSIAREIADVAYIMSDAMRKARLSSFE